MEFNKPILATKTFIITYQGQIEREKHYYYYSD